MLMAREGLRTRFYRLQDSVCQEEDWDPVLEYLLGLLRFAEGRALSLGGVGV